MAGRAVCRGLAQEARLARWEWFRKFHRWIAVPTALLIPVAVLIKLLADWTAAAGQVLVF